MIEKHEVDAVVVRLPLPTYLEEDRGCDTRATWVAAGKLLWAHLRERYVNANVRVLPVADDWDELEVEITADPLCFERTEAPAYFLLDEARAEMLRLLLAYEDQMWDEAFVGREVERMTVPLGPRSRASALAEPVA